MSEKGYDRLRIREIKNKISNKQVFTSMPFIHNMEKLANSLVWKPGKRLKVSMGEAPKVSMMGRTRTLKA